MYLDGSSQDRVSAGIGQGCHSVAPEEAVLAMRQAEEGRDGMGDGLCDFVCVWVCEEEGVGVGADVGDDGGGEDEDLVVPGLEEGEEGEEGTAFGYLRLLLLL